MSFARHCIACLLLATACSGTGQAELSYPAYASPETPGPITVGEWTVALEEATVAFGPVYFCAAATGAATLCDTAIAEIAHIARFDALDATPQPLGEVRGFEGDTRSASFDYGIHWFLTEPAPVRDPATPGGHSARLAGRAQRGEQILPFVAEIDVLAQFQGQRAVPSVNAAAHVEGNDVRLDVRFQVGEWLSGIDFDAAATAGLTPYTIEPESSDYNAIVDAMHSAHPPAFSWSGAGVRNAMQGPR